MKRRVYSLCETKEGSEIGVDERVYPGCGKRAVKSYFREGACLGATQEAGVAD